MKRSRVWLGVSCFLVVIMAGANCWAGEIPSKAGRGEPSLGGMYAKTPEMPGPSAWLYYVQVQDVAEFLPRVPELGERVPNGPMEVSDGGGIRQRMDPQGAVFALYSNANACS